MGIIRALAGAIGGGLADQWLEVYESDYMGPSTITAPGVMVRPVSYTHLTLPTKRIV